MKHPDDGIQVIGLGQASVDYLGRVPIYPHEDEKTELQDLHVQCGGPASTALVTLSRLGIRTSFLGSISDDALGHKILEALRTEKVDATFLKITPGHSSQFAFIAINRTDGKRTIFWHRGSVPRLKAEDIDLGPFRDARILLVDSLMIEAAIKAAEQAKALGLKVVMDAGTMREDSMKLLSFVDVVIASERFADPLVGAQAEPEKALEALRSFCKGNVIITLGARGSIGLENNHIIRQKAFSINVSDTTGAGDVYHGAYIYGLLRGWGMQECMHFASAASALKCQQVGARRGIPTLEDIEQFLDHRNHGNKSNPDVL
ncbi:carbohydrate kinase family protein [Thermodesulfobacteriota bacterium]